MVFLVEAPYLMLVTCRIVLPVLLNSVLEACAVCAGMGYEDITQSQPSYINPGGADFLIVCQPASLSPFRR